MATTDEDDNCEFGPSSMRNQPTLRIQRIRARCRGSCGSGPPTSERGSDRAKKPTLPCFGIDDDGDARRHRHLRYRVTRVCGLQRCGVCNRVCAGRSSRRWSYTAVGGALLPQLLCRPLVLRRRLGSRRRPPHSSGSPRRYRSTSLSKVPYHPRNQGVWNVLP